MIELEPGLSAKEIIAIRRSLCLMGYHVVRFDPKTSMAFCAYCDIYMDRLHGDEQRAAIREAYECFRLNQTGNKNTATPSYLPRAAPLDIRKRTPPTFLTDKHQRDHIRKKGKYATLSHPRR